MLSGRPTIELAPLPRSAVTASPHRDSSPPHCPLYTRLCPIFQHQYNTKKIREEMKNSCSSFDSLRSWPPFVAVAAILHRYCTHSLCRTFKFSAPIQLEKKLTRDEKRLGTPPRQGPPRRDASQCWTLRHATRGCVSQKRQVHR